MCQKVIVVLLAVACAACGGTRPVDPLTESLHAFMGAASDDDQRALARRACGDVLRDVTRYRRTEPTLLEAARRATPHGDASRAHGDTIRARFRFRHGIGQQIMDVDFVGAGRDARVCRFQWGDRF